MAPDVTTRIAEEVAPIDGSLLSFGVLIQNNRLYRPIARDIHPGGGGVYTTDLEVLELAPGGLRKESQTHFGVLPKRLVNVHGDIVFWDPARDGLFDYRTRTRHDLHSFRAQRVEPGLPGTLYVTDGRKIQIVDTASGSAWEPLLDAASLLDPDRVWEIRDMKFVGGRYLVVRFVNRFEVFDVEDPLNADTLVRFEVGRSTAADFGAVIPIGDQFLFAVDGTLSMLDPTTGYESAQITLPEPLASYQRTTSYHVTGNSVFVAGRKRVFRLTWGVDGQLARSETIALRRNSDLVRDVTAVHVEGDLLWVLWRPEPMTYPYPFRLTTFLLP